MGSLNSDHSSVTTNIIPGFTGNYLKQQQLVKSSKSKDLKIMELQRKIRKKVGTLIKLRNLGRMAWT